jgi:hypothetical protein
MKKCFLFILLSASLTGCSGTQLINVNMQDYYKKIDCPVNVIDLRPDARLLNGTNILDIMLDVSPPVKDIVYSRICQNSKIQRYLQKNKMTVWIRDIKFYYISHAWSIETILILDVSVQMGNDKHEIQASGKIDKAGGMSDYRIPLLLKESIDELVGKVEGQLDLDKL